MKNGYKIKNKKTKNVIYKSYNKKDIKHAFYIIKKHQLTSKGSNALGRQLKIEKITKQEIKKGIWKQMPF